MILNDKDVKRLWSKVNIIEDNKCWEWIASRDRHGYGYFSVTRDKITKNSTSSRATYIAVNGPIPDGLFVCHKCDNPPCCNPKHLFLGTPKDNAHDMIKKGRQATGLRALGRYKISPEIANDIRGLRIAGWKYKDLMSKFQLCKSTISYICNKKTWNHQ